MIEKINTIITSINDPLWTYILVLLLIGVGLYFTLFTFFVQVRYFPSMFRLLAEKAPKNKEGVTSFQAFAVSIASRVGTGNIAGIATAIAIGGPGAIFWMWIIALLGMSSAFVESVLAQIYKQKDGSSFIGGPAYYIQKGLNMRWLGLIFAILISLTYGFVFNMVQANTITASLKVYGANPMIVGGILAILTGVVIWGGKERIAKVSTIFVPIMALFYVVITLFMIFSNISEFPRVIRLIFENAFSGQAALGGLFSTVMMQGVKRGLFSNEAGMGSAPNAAASAHTSHPVKQGLIQSLSVFTDSMIICTCTAFMILISGLYTQGNLFGVELTQASIESQIGNIGNIFLIIAIFTFAYSTIIGNYFYSEANIKFIYNHRVGNLVFFKSCVVGLVFLGSIAEFGLVWNLADLFMAFMTMVNLYAIVRLFPQAKLALWDYDRQIKNKQNPIFKQSVLSKYNFTSDSWDK